MKRYCFDSHEACAATVLLGGKYLSAGYLTNLVSAFCMSHKAHVLIQSSNHEIGLENKTDLVG